MTAFESLIAEFSEKTGVALPLAKDGSVSLDVDGVYITVLSREAKGDVLLFSFPLGDMKPDPATMEKALTLAAHGSGTDGFHLGISDGVFVLSGATPVDGASAEDFANRILSLSAATAKVGRALAGALAEYAEAAALREKNSGASRNLSLIHV